MMLSLVSMDPHTSLWMYQTASSCRLKLWTAAAGTLACQIPTSMESRRRASLRIGTELNMQRQNMAPYWDLSVTTHPPQDLVCPVNQPPCCIQTVPEHCQIRQNSAVKRQRWLHPSPILMGIYSACL